MSIVRWDPFNEIDSLLNRTRLLSGLPRWALEGNGAAKVDWSPSTDISETDKEFLIRAELPAVKKEDVKVTVDEGMITIQGERRQQKEDKTTKFHRVESFYGTFARSFTLPKQVKLDAIRCENKDGVLTVHIPKEETAKQKPKQIKVD